MTCLGWVTYQQQRSRCPKVVRSQRPQRWTCTWPLGGQPLSLHPSVLICEVKSCPVVCCSSGVKGALAAMVGTVTCQCRTTNSTYLEKQRQHSQARSAVCTGSANAPIWCRWLWENTRLCLQSPVLNNKNQAQDSGHLGGREQNNR
jgi:hypothetical protein